MGFHAVRVGIANRGRSGNDLLMDVPVNICTTVTLQDPLNVAIGSFINGGQPAFIYHWNIINLKTNRVRNFDPPHGHYIDLITAGAHIGQTNFYMDKLLASPEDLGLIQGDPYVLTTTVSFAYIVNGYEGSSQMSEPRHIAAPDEHFICVLRR